MASKFGRRLKAGDVFRFKETVDERGTFEISRVSPCAAYYRGRVHRTITDPVTGEVKADFEGWSRVRAISPYADVELVGKEEEA